MPAEGDKYCIGMHTRFRQGVGRELLHFPLAGFNRRMSTEEASAVAQWTVFETVDDAVRRTVALMPSLSGKGLHALFSDLRDCGALVPLSQLSAATMSARESAASQPIEWITIPTAGRSGCVDRAVASYVRHLREYGRECKFFIADDSANAAGISGLPARLQLTGTAQPCVYCAGPREKQRYAEMLSAGGSIPANVIDYMLSGSRYSDRHPGANRNALLLQTLGSLVLSVDDDTVCEAAAVPTTHDSRLVMAGHYRPEDIWCFADVKSALAFVEPAPHVDVLGAHAALLGRQLGIIAQEAVLVQSGVDLDPMCSHLLTSLLCGTGRIAITSNGAAGDSGYHSNLGLLVHRSGATRKRIGGLNEDYIRVTQSRNIVRQVQRTTITHVEALSVGMFLGLDNRVLLPPFLPDFNNEDGIFAQAVGLVCDNAYAAHLPFTLAHHPPLARNYASDNGVYRVSDVIAWCLSTWHPVPGVTAEQRIALLGGHLRMLAARPHLEISEFLDVLACSHQSALIDGLESILTEDCYMPPFWADDIGRRLEAMRHVTEQGFVKPIDLNLSGSEETIPAIQTILASYGSLLEWWPAITRRVRQLADEGIELGQQICGQKG